MNVLSIQSHVAYGHVGNSSAVFPMQRMGSRSGRSIRSSSPTIPAMAPGRAESSTDRPSRNWSTASPIAACCSACDGVLSGYMGSADIGNAILSTLERVRALNPAALYCCDPVIGDVGRGIFVRPGVPEFMRDYAVPAADIITPNQFELEYLSGINDGLARRRQGRHRGRASAAARAVVLVTSIETREMPTDALDLIAGEGGRFWRVRTPQAVAQRQRRRRCHRGVVLRSLRPHRARRQGSRRSRRRRSSAC